MKSITVSVGNDKKHYMINDNCAVNCISSRKKLEDWVGNNDHNIKSSRSVKSFWCEVEIDKT